jgi:voltage-gated potassium channel
MTAQPTVGPRHSNAYNIFILVLTILSLGIMVLLILPLDEETLGLLRVYDNLICVVFLIDFAGNMAASRPRRDYFIGRRGWLDLIGSIPSFGVFRFTALLRLARLSRLARISRLLRGSKKKELVDDVLQNRGQYATFITIFSAFLVLVVASVLMIQFEAKCIGITDPTARCHAPANITSGGDALWWGIVTITTVGYGDTFPVSPLGRLTAVMVMFAGVGIIGALASILASLLVSSPTPAEEEPETASVAADAAASATPSAGMADATVAQELASIRAELAALRVSLAADRGPDRT